MKNIGEKEGEVEAALIGSLLIDPRNCQDAMDILNHDDFYYFILGDIFTVIKDFSGAGKDVDFVIVGNALKNKHPNISQWLRRSVDIVVTSQHALYYAKIIKRMSYERQIKKAVTVLAEDIEKNPSEANLENLRGLILARENLGTIALLEYKTGLHDVLDGITSKKIMPTFKTGFPDFDKATSGSRSGDVNTWAAATNVGKSLMLLNIAHRLTTEGNKCLFVGTEMAASETVERHISIASGVSAWRIRSGRLGDNDRERVYNTLADRLSNIDLAVLDHPDPTIEDIDTAISRYRPSVVFLDYLERFNLPRAESMRLRVKEFMRRLKTLARKRGVVIHLAAQLSRTVYSRDNVRPTLADISESSAVEKESDRVFLLWNPKKVQSITDGTTELEVIVGKNRHGKRGLVFGFELIENNLAIREAGENEQIPIGA